MKSIRNRNAGRLVAVAAASALCCLGGVSAAHADTPTTNAASFESFVSELKVDEATHTALAEKFRQLPEAEQADYLEAVAADPVSVMEFEDSAGPAIVVTSPDGARDRAASSRYTATYPVSVSMFGITTGTFNLRYVFEATPSAVTRNLECTGWFSGASGVWSINSTTSQYTSGGSGTCTVLHRMSFLYKDSAWSANKQHHVTYRGINLVSGWLKNV